jgi:hypothetical protein
VNIVAPAFRNEQESGQPLFIAAELDGRYQEPDKWFWNFQEGWITHFIVMEIYQMNQFL